MTPDERLTALLAEHSSDDGGFCNCDGWRSWGEAHVAAVLTDAGLVWRDDVAGAWRLVEERLVEAGVPDAVMEKAADAALAAVTEHLGGGDRREGDRRLAAAKALVDHWKGHAEEAEQGFSRVCKDYARVSSRNVKLLNRLTAAEATLARVEAVCAAGDVRTLDDFREECVTLDDIRAALASEGTT